jgi:protein-S-isoprenylcysteine O-methyltransferase
VAQLTARKAFTQHLAYERVEGHKLVTNGIYSVVRHPGYLGMFYFAVGTQIFLRNPVSLVVFVSVLWKFFKDRIEEEEMALVAMFGDDYIEYREKTKTFIPFIK